MKYWILLLAILSLTLPSPAQKLVCAGNPKLDGICNPSSKGYEMVLFKVYTLNLDAKLIAEYDGMVEKIDIRPDCIYVYVIPDRGFLNFRVSADGYGYLDLSFPTKKCSPGFGYDVYITVSKGFFSSIGYQLAPKSPIGFWCNFSGLIAKVGFSPYTFAASWGDIVEKEVITREEMGCYLHQGSRRFYFHLGYDYMVFDRMGINMGCGYGSYANVYKYNNQLYTPAKCRGLELECGPIYNCKIGKTKNLRFACTYSLLFSEKKFGDINFGVQYNWK